MEEEQPFLQPFKHPTKMTVFVPIVYLFKSLTSSYNYIYCKESKLFLHFSSCFHCGLTALNRRLIAAVQQQSQTVAVFIRKAATDPVACWDAGLVAQTGCCASALDYLRVWSHFEVLYLCVLQLPAIIYHFCLVPSPPKTLFLFIFYPDCFIPSPPQTPALWFLYFFRLLSLLPSVSLAAVAARLSFCPLSCSLFACLSARLPVMLSGFPVSGQVLDNKHPADITAHKKRRTEEVRERRGWVWRGGWDR